MLSGDVGTEVFHILIVSEMCQVSINVVHQQYGPCNVEDLEPGTTKKWCTCGLSKMQPWCNGMFIARADVPAGINT